MEATARTRVKSSISIRFLFPFFFVLCTLASISAAAPPAPTPSQAGGGNAGGQAQCLYVTNTGNGRLQVIDVATARLLPFWTLESRSSSSATPEETTSPSPAPLSEEARLLMGANQTGLTVGKNPTGLWIEHPYLFISYKWQGHISIYNLNKGLELVGRIENQKLLWCWSGQIAFSRDILYVTCIDDLQIHRFRWEGPDRSLLNFTILSSIPTLRPTYGLKYSNKTDNTSALLVSTPSANTVYLLNTSSPTAATQLQPFVQQPEPVVSYSGIETRFDTLYVIDGTNSFVRYFSMSDPNISGIFIDFSVEANNTLIYQLSDFVDLEFGNYNATTGQPNNLFITSQRSDRIELFNADGKYLGPFLVGKEDGTTISEPQNLFFHSCPVLSYPQMNSQNAGKSEGFNIDLLLGLLVPLMAILILLVFVFPLALFFIYSYRNRRRTFDPMDEEEMGGTQPKERRKYVYREIEPTDLTLGEILGVGAFGKVYQGCWRGGPVAVKVFDTVKLSEANDDVIDEIRKEAEMMEKLGNHPSVISFVGAITRPSAHFNGVALVTEYCSRGSLFELLVKGRARVPPALLVRMARDAAAGIRHLHRERIVHRDIAARNVLVGENYNAYIADFGLARVLKGDTDTTNSNFGPVRWMAPEAMVRREYSEASDAFSFGVLLWEMVTRKVPWRGIDSSQIIIAVAQKNTRLKIPKGCDPILRKIMKGVWKENPRQRMTMAQVLQTLTDYYSILAQYEVESDCDAATDSESESVWGTSGERQARSRSAGDPAARASSYGCGKDEKCNSDEGGERVAATDSTAAVLVPRLRSAQLVQRRAAGSDAFRICSPLSPRRHRRHHRPREAEAREMRAEVRSDSWEVYTCSLPPSSASPPQALDLRGPAASHEKEGENDDDDEQKTESESENENENEAERERRIETETEDEVSRESSGDTQLSPITPRFALDESVEVYTSLTVPATKRRRCTASDGFLEQQPGQ